MSNETDKPTEFELDEWSRCRPVSFDLEAQLDARIKPLLDALMTECRSVGMPILVICNYSHDNNRAGQLIDQHFPSPSKTPPSLLFALHAARGEFAGMQAVLQANEHRLIMSKITQH